MELMRLDTAPSSPRDRVFRYSRARASLAGLATLGVSGGLAVVAWQQRAMLALYIAGVLVVALLVLHRLVLARFRASNWLVRMSDAGLFVQFRSYLNSHFPPEDPTVVFIPYEEIRAARLVRRQDEVPDGGGRRLRSVTVRSRWLVELELAGETAPLARALANERAAPAPKAVRRSGRASTRYHHYPVRMASPARLELEWAVVPSAAVFLEALRVHTAIEAPLRASRDYVSLEGLSPGDQETRLLELVEAGQLVAAVQVARKLYACDLAAARAFVEELRSGKGPRTRS